MTYKPKISVITAVYNGERYLAEAIESVLAQTFTDFEYVIVDDGSTDKTPEIIKKFVHYDSRINSVRIENSGLANALNIGLRIAKRPWIARLDADDVCLSFRLEEQVKFVQEHPDCILLGSGCIEITADGKVIKEHHYPCDHKSLVKNLETRNKFFPHSSSFYRRMMGSTAIRYNARFILTEDYNLWLMFSELNDIGRIGCVDKPLLKLRRHIGSITNTDSGNIQIFMVLAALICHLRRKAGLSDPSQMEEDTWKRFLIWLNGQLEIDKYFHRRGTWKRLRSIWYSDDLVLIKKVEALMTELASNQLIHQTFWERFRKDNLPVKLAEQSRAIC